MNTWAAITICSLSILAGLSIVGLIHSAYRDNLLQCVGMGGVLLFGISQVNRIWHAGDVADPSLALLFLALALFGLGIAVKVTLHLGREKQWGIVVKWDQAVTERKTASGAFDSKPHHHV